MNSLDLAFAPALEQSRLIREREISPLELVELYLDRIQHLNASLGSYFTVTAEQAIADARTKTEHLATVSNPTELPLLFGVPIAIKDMNNLAGVPTSYGVAALKHRIVTQDDGVVARLKQAGMIILGKTAISELGSFPYTEPDGFPPARNPWHLDYTPGGSSGGAAAALAAGLCPLAQGSDAGGSIRGPAFCCGVVGIKPSRGRISWAPVGDALSGIAVLGPLARTVTDAAALLDVMSGYQPGDPYWLPDPDPTFLTSAQQGVFPARSLRVAFATGIPLVGAADPVCQQAVLATVQILEEMGHHIEANAPDYTGLIEPFALIWKSAVAATGIPAEYLGTMNRWLLANSGSSGDYLRAVGAVQKIARQIVRFFETIDVLVLPTYLHPPIRVGAWNHLQPEEILTKIIEWIAPCPPFNTTGQPAIALPTGFTPEGLPVGIQLVGRPAAEATLLGLAAQLEAARPWAQHRPKFAGS
jgi:amidase